MHGCLPLERPGTGSGPRTLPSSNAFGRARRPRGAAEPGARLPRSLALALAAAVLLSWGIARAASPADTLPFSVVYGRPDFARDTDVSCYLWSEGGRLHVRLQSTAARHKVRGELRTNRSGSFRDVTPSSEDILIKQQKPSRLEFETLVGRHSDEGLDVVLTGDFDQLTIDFSVDAARRADAVRIGARGDRPRGLPARLDVKGGDPSWLKRFGF
jgi:hypothetical protein